MMSIFVILNTNLVEIIENLHSVGVIKVFIASRSLAMTCAGRSAS